jgi:hypothetical protein
MVAADIQVSSNSNNSCESMHCNPNSTELAPNEMVLPYVAPLRPIIPVPTDRKKNFFESGYAHRNSSIRVWVSLRCQNQYDLISKFSIKSVDNNWPNGPMARRLTTIQSVIKRFQVVSIIYSKALKVRILTMTQRPLVRSKMTTFFFAVFCSLVCVVGDCIFAC